MTRHHKKVADLFRFGMGGFAQQIDEGQDYASTLPSSVSYRLQRKKGHPVIFGWRNEGPPILKGEMVVADNGNVIGVALEDMVSGGTGLIDKVDSNDDFEIIKITEDQRTAIVKIKKKLKAVDNSVPEFLAD